MSASVRAVRLRWRAGRAGGFRVRVAAGRRWQAGGIPENGIFVCPGAYFSYLWKVKAGKQEKKESKFVKTKIVTGYVVLVVVCILAVGYAYRAMIHIAAPGENYALLQVKRRAVNQTLYHLYQAESYGQLMIAGYQSYEERYHRELRTVHACIDSLRGLSDDTDSLQTLRLDSIVRLIADKERRTMSLRRSIRSAGTASLLDKNIRQLLEGDDSLGGADTSLVLRSVVLSDTVSVPRSKRRFFRRLADLFSPRQEDSSIVISRREFVGAVSPQAVKDTIALVLRALQDSVTSERLGIYDKAWRQGQQLRYNNELVNEKIYRLIMDYEAEDTGFLMRRIERNAALRRRSSQVLGGITTAAVLLMLIFVAVLWRDVNRSNRYRRALERANRDNEALLAAREKLMLAITHDIKAPLGSVMGYIDLLSRLTGGKREELYLHNMKESSEHLLRLVNSLLDFYRLDINKMEVNTVAFNPAQLFETILSGFAAQAAAKGLELHLDATPAAATGVTGDAVRIRQIAENLLSNALKFTDRGSVTVRVDLSDGRLIFSVRDTGCGIAREEKERIFGEFVRLRSAQGVDGFGLGLSIVDRLVKLLGGTISLESRLGEGSRFIVSVPVGAAGDAGAAPAAAVSESEVRPGLRVLLVDDDPLQLEMTAAMCRRAGIETESCAYPEYVGRIVAESRFDLVLTDIQMPSADGFSVLDTVHRVDASLPVVAVSARGEMRPADFAARGFAACLRKPFSGGELLAAIRAATGGGGEEAAAPAGGADAPAAELPASGDGVDFGALTAYAGDDPEAARSIVASFAEQTGANAGALRRALEAEDAAALKALAHKMLPIFTMIGAAEVAAVLRRAERFDGEIDPALRSGLQAALGRIDAIVARAAAQAADPAV